MPLYILPFRNDLTSAVLDQSNISIPTPSVNDTDTHKVETFL